VGFGRQNRGVHTGSRGSVYVFWQGGYPQTRHNTIFLTRWFSGGFFGDYTDISAASNGNFHAFWTNSNNVQTVVWF
jgi:hypothetical protein